MLANLVKYFVNCVSINWGVNRFFTSRFIIVKIVDNFPKFLLENSETIVIFVFSFVRKVKIIVKIYLTSQEPNKLRYKQYGLNDFYWALDKQNKKEANICP